MRISDAKLKTQFDKKPALYYIAIGDKDFLYPANTQFRQMLDQSNQQIERFNSPEGKAYMQSDPSIADQYKTLQNRQKVLGNMVKLFDYLESANNKPSTEPAAAGAQPY